MTSSRSDDKDIARTVVEEGRPLMAPRDGSTIWARMLVTNQGGWTIRIIDSAGFQEPPLSANYDPVTNMMRIVLMICKGWRAPHLFQWQTSTRLTNGERFGLVCYVGFAGDGSEVEVGVEFQPMPRVDFQLNLIGVPFDHVTR